MPEILSPGLHPGIPAHVYHAGLTRDPRPLSSTLAKNLLRTLPAEARWHLENHEDKPAYATGTAIHELLLQGELQTIVEFPYDSWRTKEAREARDGALIEGATPMLTKDLDQAREIVAAARGNTDVTRLLDASGHAEISALATIEGVPVQARYDYLAEPATETGAGYIVDVKTVAGSAHPDQFNRAAATYGYHIQAALYRRVLEELGHGELPFYWIVISKQEPYAASVIKASEIDLMTGSELVDRALNIWRDVIKHGWPATTGITESSLPAWAHYEVEDQEIQV